MIRFCAVLVWFGIVAVLNASAEDCWHAVGPAFKVHGRLSIARNGTLSPRIWIVGTKRILGVPPAYGDDPVYLPHVLSRLAWDYYIFADFTVVPFTEERPGVMRIVRIISAENAVVTDWDLKIVRRLEGRIEPGEPILPKQVVPPSKCTLQ